MLRSGRGTVLKTALGRVWIDCCGEIDVAKGARDTDRGSHPRPSNQSSIPSHSQTINLLNCTNLTPSNTPYQLSHTPYHHILSHTPTHSLTTGDGRGVGGPRRRARAPGAAAVHLLDISSASHRRGSLSAGCVLPRRPVSEGPSPRAHGPTPTASVRTSPGRPDVRHSRRFDQDER